MENQDNLDRYLPLSPEAFHVMVALAADDKHGWAILKEVAGRTNGRIRLSPGTLYGIIKRLLRQHLIAESDQRPPEKWDDRRRRYYRLTDLGCQVVKAEIHRIEDALEVARAANLVTEPQTGPLQA